ncbi:YbdD/YjiX family protein [Caulobacter sp. 73W]|uniref:YbdD/YjiX family protein n=1 Tax=Caulobacter sp. 73W TaxID=3161137 RepID=A0AB39KX01_9CAUL
MLEDLACRCRDVALGWGREARRTANLMIGQPDYDAYVRHAADRHPDEAPLDRVQLLSPARGAAVRRWRRLSLLLTRRLS